MLSADIESYLAEGLHIMGLSLSSQPESLARLAEYFQELLKWNQKVNLVARSLAEKQILESHFLDSLALLGLLPEENHKQESLLDIGTGGGFPGLVLKAACPDLPVTLVEPRRNRFYFLKHIIRLLQLKDVKVLAIRLEKEHKSSELAGQHFSCITSRAFVDSQDFITLAGPYLGKDGRLVLMKGPGVVAEMKSSCWRNLPAGFYVADTTKLQLPFSKKERWLVSIGLQTGNRGTEEKNSFV